MFSDVYMKLYVQIFPYLPFFRSRVKNTIFGVSVSYHDKEAQQTIWYLISTCIELIWCSNIRKTYVNDAVLRDAIFIYHHFTWSTAIKVVNKQNRQRSFLFRLTITKFIGTSIFRTMPRAHIIQMTNDLWLSFWLFLSYSVPYKYKYNLSSVHIFSSAALQKLSFVLINIIYYTYTISMHYAYIHIRQ